MVTYDEMCTFSRFYNLLVNRVDCCNQLLGCRYRNSSENDVRITYKKGCYSVTAYDAEIAAFRVWDLDGVLKSYAYVDSWADCLWHLSRKGRIVAA